jgi:hypothetical protein
VGVLPQMGVSAFLWAFLLCWGFVYQLFSPRYKLRVRFYSPCALSVRVSLLCIYCVMGGFLTSINFMPLLGCAKSLSSPSLACKVNLGCKPFEGLLVCFPPHHLGLLNWNFSMAFRTALFCQSGACVVSLVASCPQMLVQNPY